MVNLIWILNRQSLFQLIARNLNNVEKSMRKRHMSPIISFFISELENRGKWEIDPHYFANKVPFDKGTMAIGQTSNAPQNVRFTCVSSSAFIKEPHWEWRPLAAKYGHSLLCGPQASEEGSWRNPLIFLSVNYNGVTPTTNDREITN